MVGAITVLIAIVTVFLAYNANAGLPFVSDLQHLGPASRRRQAGDRQRGAHRRRARRARSPRSRPRRTPRPASSTPSSSSALDPDVEELPSDSTMTVRARSALGLKYLEIVQGDVGRGLRLGRDHARHGRWEPAGDIEDFLNTFDEPTRDAMQANLFEFGNALAGRGPDLNAALGELPDALENLEPVMRNLSSPDTHLERFVVTIAAAAGEVAPVARRAGGDVRQSRYDLHRARAAWRPRSRRRSPRRRPRSSSPRRPCPPSGRSWRTARRSSTSCARACRHSTAAAPDHRRGARGRRGPAERLTQAQPRAARQPRSRSRTSTTTARLARALTASSRRWTCSARRSTTSARRRPSATTGASSSTTWRAPPASGPERRAASSGSRCSSRPRGPNNEGSLARRAGERRRPTRKTSSTSTRIRTPPRPARTRSSARRGTSRIWSASRSSATCPGDQGIVHGQPAPVPAQEGRAMRLSFRREKPTGPPRPGDTNLDPRVWGRRYRGPHPAWWGLIMVVLLPSGLRTSPTPRSCRGATRATP